MIIDTNQLYTILEDTPDDQNIMLVGKHGIGKSQILTEYYSKKGMQVITLFLGQMNDPGDIIGLPDKNEKTNKTEFLLPYWFPTDNKPIILFLDELNRARPEVLQTIMDLTLNRKLAGKTLPEGSRIVSAVNDGIDYQLTELDPALVSRFNIYEFDPTVDDWLSWACANNLDHRIISFIQDNPDYLDGDSTYRQEAGLNRTPDRRSWKRASDVMKKYKVLTDDKKAIFTGIVGQVATRLLFEHVNSHRIPGAKQILLEDFEDCITALEDLSVPELCTVNTNLFNFIDSKSYLKTKKKSIAKNLELYYDFLIDNTYSEAVGHLVSLCSSEKYPESLFFITMECRKLYEKLLEFMNGDNSEN
ncbi:MAG: AAA family ATPase [Treponema sp.]|nr:AAA family ATPase [Treponema sp.]